MTTRKHLSLALLAAYAASLTGCASGFGWWGGTKNAVNNNPAPAALVQQPAKPTIASSVLSALTIKPKVTPADDPLSVNGKQGPVSPEVYLSAARLYENRGEVEAAATQYRKALEIAPKSLPALIGYARLQDRQNNFDEAAKLYRKAIAAHPQSATAYNDLGLCQARHGQSEAALESIQKAVQIEPANALYRNNAASVLVDMGRSREAFEHLVLAHGEAVAHYNLGYLLFQRDKIEQANAQFALAVEKDSSLAQARDMLTRSGGLASRDPVQKIQHIAQQKSPQARAGKPAASPIQVSPAYSTPVSSGSAPQRSDEAPRPLPSASRPQRVQSTAAQSVAPASISFSQPPVQSFPPVRLPEINEPREEADAEPAPLPDESTLRSTGRQLSDE